MQSHTLETDEASVVYDVAGQLPPAGGRPLLFMIGQPMEAGGFRALASHFPDRTVVTYDPRGLGRSSRKDGGVDNDPVVHARDLHDIIEALGAGPVEMFASSGGAITSLALVASYPSDVITLVAHEPPLPAVLRDEQQAQRALARFREAYASGGFGAGMAAFIATTMWHGEFNDQYFAQPLPDPAQFGLPAEDDGARDNVLLSHRSDAVTDYRPNYDALKAAPTRLVIALGEESTGTFTARAAQALAERLALEPVVVPSHHGGFAGADSPLAGQPAAFAQRLRDVLISSEDNSGHDGHSSDAALITARRSTGDTDASDPASRQVQERS
jgi:pimeloyl-ACP methyl ester carboxylesterase